jgi:molecular chaperone GrpE
LAPDPQTSTIFFPAAGIAGFGPSFAADLRTNQWSAVRMNGQMERSEDDSQNDSQNDQEIVDANGTAAESDAAEMESADGVLPSTEEETDPLAVAQATADENWNKYVRAAAELDNVRKRAARDVDNAHKFALERFATDLLAVCDSFEMGLATAETADADQLRTGSENTLKLLTTTLDRFGVTEIDPEGEPFDPEFHEAVAMQPSADVEPGSVMTVFQKGYSLNGRLLRPARVVVAQEKPPSD